MNSQIYQDATIEILKLSLKDEIGIFSHFISERLLAILAEFRQAAREEGIKIGIPAMTALAGCHIISGDLNFALNQCIAKTPLYDSEAIVAIFNKTVMANEHLLVAAVKQPEVFYESASA